MLDRWDLHPGADIPAFMEKAVRDSDYILLVCTEKFAEKANEGYDGVGYEKTIITGEIYQRISSPRKFVPLLRSGKVSKALPSYLRSKFYIDFTHDNTFNKSLEDLLRHMHDSPRYNRPPLGKKPHFTSEKRNPIVSNEIIYCSRCGASIGQKSECTGLSVSHNFVAMKKG
ncbi:hypothetical protein E4H04_01400 [Candidatus Bathyarchaeota archaeon]|nr:MAG: hypothetical protein E4H04_01400 [Candidatus Bathyarchaeota archaeon]